MNVVLWADVPLDQRQDERRCPIWGTRVTHRGCAAAVQWSDGVGWHRCATQASKKYGLCSRHAQRAGLIEPVLGDQYPHGLDSRTRNVIKRNTDYRMTAGDFRRLSDDEIDGFRNAGRLTVPVIRQVRDTWTDDELVKAFGFRASSEDMSGDFAVCNWVGEAVSA